MGPKPNREILTGGKRYAQKKTKQNRVEEVTFDKESRLEFLTGFHKRKLQRKKKAQEFLVEQERKARLEERKRIREERKAVVQKRLADLNANLDIGKYLSSSDEEEEEENADESAKTENVEEMEWIGFKDTQGTNSDDEDESDKEFKKNKSSNGKQKKGILKVKQIYNVENEDAPVTGISEVTIETLENPNSIDFSTLARINRVDLDKSKEVLDGSITKAKEYARLVGADDNEKSKKSWAPKPRKKKFRYLSKSERKIKNMKEKKAASKKRPPKKKE